MKYFLKFIFLYSLFFQCLAYDVTDDAGRHLSFSHPPKRIISLSPDLTENLFLIGAGEKIVGVVSASDYPENAKKIPQVATDRSMDAEKILALQPDLIVAWAETSYIPALEKLNIPLYLSHPRRIKDIPELLIKLGKITGNENKAKEKAAIFLEQYAIFKKTYHKSHFVRVFYQVWPKPLMTINRNNWINDVIDLCGGQNIFADLNKSAPTVTLEAVILKDPEVIIGNQFQKNWQSMWQGKPIQAVKNNSIFFIDTDLLERPTPRLFVGAKKICEILKNFHS